ncbi:MAG: hypothetical protein WBF73_11665, partial [Bradyrhizobium sp.]
PKPPEADFSRPEKSTLGKAKAQEEPMTIWITAGFVLGYLLACRRPPPYPDVAACFAARLASSRNVFAITARFFAFSGSGFFFARSCRRFDISIC